MDDLDAIVPDPENSPKPVVDEFVGIHDSEEITLGRIKQETTITEEEPADESEKTITAQPAPTENFLIAKQRSNSPAAIESASSQRVFKKSSPNNKLTIYLHSRDLSISEKEPDRLQGVVVVDPEFLADRKVYGQITLTFRYGREDEEVMGLKFCNEAVMSLAQLYPPHERAPVETNTPLQEALLRRLGPHAHPFNMTVVNVAPPSVQLVPAKEYSGAPIGTSYDIRVYAGDRPDEKLHRRSTIRMGIRVVQRATPYSLTPESPSVVTSVATGQQNQTTGDLRTSEPPRATVGKPFLLSEGRVELEASLDKATYHHGDPILVTVTIKNNSGKTVRRIKVFVVQHVDVCMFSNGKFKNVVAMLNCKEDVPLSPRKVLTHTYQLHPAKGTTKNWIALEDSLSKGGSCLASTVSPPSSNPHDRNVFAIYVSYYVKVKIQAGAMGGELSLKLPFTLVHAPREEYESCHLPVKVKIASSYLRNCAQNDAKSENQETREGKPTCSFNLEVSSPRHDPKVTMTTCSNEEST